MNGMFHSCSALTSLNLSNFNTSLVNDMRYMFQGLSLTSLDLSFLDTSEVKNMAYMFNGCIKLNSLNISNLNTSQVTDMSYMFYNCQSLTSIDLSNFETSRVINMNNMFGECKKLDSLKMDSFITSNVKNMDYMFNGCTGLKLLDLSNFDTSLINEIKGMFSGCTNLISLDLSNFKTSKLNDISNLFSGCSKLEYLNLSNFDTSSVINFSGMFYGCSALNLLDISKFNTSNSKDMSYMFNGCINITSLDLSNFDTSQVINMKYMFNGCTKLSSINIYNFNTSNVQNISYMFSGCKSMTSFNLSNFDTSQVINMNGFFSGCTSLISLDLSNFVTTKVNDTGYMFSKCSNLEYLNLPNFNESKIENMAYMFNECPSLISLDLSNFNIIDVTNMTYMFNECRNLSYLGLSNFKSSKVSNMSHMFTNCSSLNSIDLSNLNTSEKNDVSYIFYGCSSLASLNLSNFAPLKVRNVSYMFYNCTSLISLDLSNLDTSEIKNMSNIFYGCSKLNSLDISNFNMSLVTDMNNMFYDCSNLEYINLKSSEIKSDINISTENIFLFTPKNLMACSENENDILINLLGEKINIYCDDIYVNKYYCYMKNYSLYNNYMCDICQNNFTYIYNESNTNYSYINCFEPKIVLCYNSCKTCEIEGNETNNNCIECKDDFIYEFIEPTTYMINNIYPHYTSELINGETSIIITSTNVQVENKTEKIQNIINNLIVDFNITDTQSGNDKKIVEKDKVIIFTSTENQKNEEKDNYVSMDLGECENILKNHYNIPMNNSLYILQIVSQEEGMKIPKLEYEVYYPLNNSKDLTKLNLTLCEGTKVEISISVDINGTLDLFDPNSEYYNEICVISTSEIGTDIPLRDRRNEFVKNNLSLCEENCELVDYNKETKKVKCSCDMKSSISSNFDNKFNKDEFFNSFTDIKNILNLNIMKCFKEVLSFDGLKKNYGFFIMLTIFTFYIITLLLFPNFSFKKMKKEIKSIIWALKSHELNIISINKNKLIMNKPDIVRKNLKRKTKKHHSNKKNMKAKHENNKIKVKIRLDQEDSNYKMNNNENNNDIINEDQKLIQTILKQYSFELNSLDYEKGIKLDKRNYFEYYGSLLKYNHPILFSFAPYNDYNSKIIKIFLFFFSFCSDLTINALFFTDDTMHKIHEDKGKFDFLYQIPQIIYSSLISRIIDTLLRKLALSQDNIVDLKQEKNITKKKQKSFIRILRIKFTLYFLSSFIILLFFWYYITCFCGIYVNTQMHLLKDSLVSLLASLLIPFVLYLIPGIFRIAALRAEKQNQKLLYKFSCILENLLG